jgi:hypothetical protein
MLVQSKIDITKMQQYQITLAALKYNDTNYTKNSGEYYPSSDTIILYGKYRLPDQLIKTAHHEIAHYIHDKYLTIEQQEEYLLLYKNQTIYVTSYSYPDCNNDSTLCVNRSIQQSAEEDFAETFAEYIFRGCTLPRQFAERLEYFNKIDINQYIIMKGCT